MNSLPPLPTRSPDSHKGDFGRGLLVGGSMGMSGAIALAGMASLRAGAGLIKLAVPEPCLDVVASFEPSYMTASLPADKHGRIAYHAWPDILPLAEGCTAVAIGPGLGRSTSLDLLVTRLYEELPMPLVIDADGLNALATRKEPLSGPVGPRILTPHPGEFARLVVSQSEAQTSTRDRQQQETAAAKLATEFGVTIVLKGHRTFVASADSTSHNTTGNPGMATGGSGDVLTGIILALLCQGLAPFAASQLGVHVHGLAGDLAAQDKGQAGLIARDLVDYLPAAMKQLAA